MVARGIAVLALVVLFAAAPAAYASLRVGAVEDAAKWGNPKAKMDLAKLAGFDSVRMTMQWSAGRTAPDAAELSNTQAAVQAADADGIEPVISIYNTGSSSTPADAAARAQFVQFATAVVQGLPSVNRFIVGNEPNSNLYWLPQFNTDGSDAAAPAYEALLAATYDAIKQTRPDAVVIGGALDPRGGDNPAGTKPTHSPTTFIADLGAAYRASGRAAPIMDEFDQHVYADNSSLPPSMEHPNTTTIAEADYGKLVALLGQAFDGTGQRGSTLPILYGEFGVESTIPPAKAPLYSGVEPSTSKPVDEATQAQYYTEAFKLAYCQPNVVGIMVFHVSDESALTGWQSGPYYADDSPKSSLSSIRDAADAVRAGRLTSCPDTNAPTVALTAPTGSTIVGPSGLTLSATASDDVGVGKVEFLANGDVVGTKFAPPYSTTWTPTASGTYALSVRAQDAVRNVATASPVTVTADVTPPVTTITSAPPAATGSHAASLSFTASEPATFECSLDGSAWTACTSPATYATSDGAHTFAVRGTDALGNVEPTPASTSWTVYAPPTVTSFAPASGPVGTTVSISGSNLAGATGVTVAGAAAPFTVVSSSEIQATVPAGIAQGPIEVTTPGGSAGGTGTFTVVAPPPPPSPPPPQTSGGSSSGGIAPDIHVEATASSAAPPPVGSSLLFFVTVSSKNVGGSSAVRLDLTLPTGYTFDHVQADRGPGCAGPPPVLTCDVAWINQTTSTRLTVFGTVAQPGELDLTATATSLLEPEFDSSDNTATLKLVPPPPAPPTADPPLSTPRPSGARVAGGVLHVPLLAGVRYRWQLCTPKRCVTIPGATKTSLRLLRSYAGKSVRVVEQRGSATVVSTQIPVRRSR